MMGETLRIICLWICFHSWLLGYADVKVEAVPFEYFDDHDDQLSYDMDTEQSKAKYDPRILSEQLIEQNSKEGEQGNDVNDSEQHDDIWPHERAASCYSGTTKYTHGQKISREDPCEVCLCVDGEIFCWWKRCDETLTKSKHTNKLNPLGLAEEVSDTKKSTSSATTTTTKTTTAAATTTTSTTRPSQNEGHSKKEKLKNRIQKKLQGIEDHQRAQLPMHHSSPVSTSLASNKILNFPEHLPSVLYYDYKTEEHKHHQHQHQHMKQHHFQKQLRQHEHSSIEKHRSGGGDGGGIGNGFHSSSSSTGISNKRQQKSAQQLSDITIGNMPSAKLSVNRIMEVMPLGISSAPVTNRLLLQKDTSNTYYASYMPDDDDIRNNLDAWDDNRVKNQSDMEETPAGGGSSRNRNNGKISLESLSSTLLPLTLSQLPNDSDKSSQSFIDNTFRRILNGRNHKSIITSAEDYRLIGKSSKVPTFITGNNSDIKLTPPPQRRPRPPAEADEYSPADDVFTLTEVSTNIREPNSGIINETQILYMKKNQHHHRNRTAGGDDDPTTSFRSTYNDFSSEFNASSVNLNLILPESGQKKSQQLQQQQKQQQQQHRDRNEPIILEVNSILNVTSLATNNTNSWQVPEVTTFLTGLSQTAGWRTSINNNVTAGSARTEATTTTATTPSALITTTEEIRECIVMGTTYRIGEVLPQETGNCLQCVCIDGTATDDTPRVTCSPHNCPPLVLPDLFDATGY